MGGSEWSVRENKRRLRLTECRHAGRPQPPFALGGLDVFSSADTAFPQARPVPHLSGVKFGYATAGNNSRARINHKEVEDAHVQRIGNINPIFQRSAKYGDC